jgi:hypothetical protein
MRLAVLFGITVFMQFLIQLGSPVQSATLDEVIAMHEAGLSAEVIIKVLDATGMETAIDAETLVSLKEQGLDDEVLSRLADFISSGIDDSRQAESTVGPDSAYQDNRLGGEGFHSNRSYSTPPYYQEYDQQGYYQRGNFDNSRYQTPFNTPLGSIWISRPPVYVFRRGGYVQVYPYGQYYDYGPGYRDGSPYSFYDNSYFAYGWFPTWYGDHRGHDHGRGHGFGGSLDGSLDHGNIRVRIHF